MNFNNAINPSMRQLVPRIIIYLLLLAIFIIVILFFESKFYRELTKSNNNLEEITASDANSINPGLPQISSVSPEATFNLEKISNFEVPILMYHYIRNWNKPDDQTGATLSVSPSKFDEQMLWLVNHKYQSVDFSYFFSPYRTSFKPIIIAFDDGYHDAYTNAFPILKKYKLSGMFYIITGKVGTSDHLTWDMIKEMNAGGMHFGSHTARHLNLTGTTDKVLTDELKTSKEKLEAQLNTSITDFCYPTGKYDDRVIFELKKTGYKTGITTQNGTADEKSDLYKLPRIRVQNNTNMAGILPST